MFKLLSCVNQKPGITVNKNSDHKVKGIY